MALLMAYRAQVINGQSRQARQTNTKDEGFSNLARYTSIIRNCLNLLKLMLAALSRHQHLLKASVMSHRIHSFSSR